MKSKILIILMMAICNMVYSQDKIKLYPKVALSYCNESYKMISEDGIGYSQDKFPHVNVRTGLEVKYKGVSLYYDTKIWCKPERNMSFSPTQASFSIGACYNVTSKVKVSIEHVCWHPLDTDGEYHSDIYGGKNEISISYGY